MLLNFSVSNYKSIKTEQSLNLSSTNSMNAVSTGHHKAPHILQSVAILGANSSGKSNILEALLTARNIVKKSHQYSVDKKLPIHPYALDAEFLQTPTKFSFNLLSGDYFYEYEFLATADSIKHEQLYATSKSGKRQKWFVRDSMTSNEDWYINPKIKGRKEDWKKETKNNVLLLSLIGTLKNQPEIQNVVKAILSIKLMCNLDLMRDNFTSSSLISTPEKKEKIRKFLADADLGFEDFETKVTPFTQEMLPESMPAELKTMILKNESTRMMCQHFVKKKMENGQETWFDFAETESSGTLTMFKFAAPIIDVLEHGYTLAVDELDRSLHFKELEYIVKLFKDPKTNPNNAQIIFTTHSTSVMQYLDREELFLVNKADGFQTTIKSFLKLEKRTDAPLEIRYLKNRYKSFPKIPKNKLFKSYK